MGAEPALVDLAQTVAEMLKPRSLADVNRFREALAQSDRGYLVLAITKDGVEARYSHNLDRATKEYLRLVD